MKTLFFRLLNHADNAMALSEAIDIVREGRAANAEVSVVDPTSFSQVPGSPFAYWVSENVVRRPHNTLRGGTCEKSCSLQESMNNLSGTLYKMNCE